MELFAQNLIVFLFGIFSALTGILMAVSGSRPHLKIDNRIYYEPLERRYNYCIKVTNKSKRHCMYDLEFNSNVLYTLDNQSGNIATPIIDVWSLPKGYLKPEESQLFYIYLNNDSLDTIPALSNFCFEQSGKDPKNQLDFRKVFHAAENVELQVILKCKHGKSGQTRVFYKRFLKKDFYNHLKLEA